MPRTSLSKLVDEDEINVVQNPTKKEFDQSDGILCKSVVQGALYMKGEKTGIPYTFTDYGDVSEIEYRDLVAAVRSKSAYIFNPYIVVENDDFIAEFPSLKKFYSDQYTVSDLKSILKLPVNEMLAEIKKLPSGAKESLKSIAATQVSNGNLDSVKKIKALDDVFGTDLNLVGEIFSDD